MCVCSHMCVSPYIQIIVFLRLDFCRYYWVKWEVYLLFNFIKFCLII